MLGYVRVLTKGSSSILERFRAFKRDKCFCLRNLIYGYTKNMCLSKAEIQAIKERVNNTEEGAQRFKEWEQAMPTVQEGIKFLQSELYRVQELNQIYTSGIIELYHADIENDAVAKREIFSRFGLPDILKHINN